MTTDSKAAIIPEWEEWMQDFLTSEFQVLRDVSAKVHNVDDGAKSVLTSRILKNHRVNLLQESFEQVHLVSKELTMMVRNAPAPLSTSDIAHAMHFGIYEALPVTIAVQDNLSPRRQTLCHLSLSYLKKASNRTKYTNPEYTLPLKDAFVSLSGIWNMFCQDANSAFKDDYERGLDACAVKDLDNPDMGFAAIVAPLVEMAEHAAKTETGVKAQALISKIYYIQATPGSEIYCRSLGALKTITAAGNGVLGVEPGLTAARQSNLDLFEIFGIHAGTRKRDSIMTVEDLEVANFELKKALCTEIQDDIQLRRTIKATKSIRMEATAFSLKKLDDIWVAGPACDKVILPQTEAEILDFMKNDMHRLFSLLFLYDQYSREVLVKKAEYERQFRRSNKVVAPLPSEESEFRDLEWDLLVLNSPAKQAGRRKSIVEHLRDIDEDNSAPNSPYIRKSTSLDGVDTKGSIASRLRSVRSIQKTFEERLEDAAVDEED
ncbi:hypothetical protein BGX24_004077 [Mortierella sp. AD032]|nr:hypothetical protein BGX24_004077 [Mortierella sp. AD032]